jgi:hypothetical protein
MFSNTTMSQILGGISSIQTLSITCLIAGLASLCAAEFDSLLT